MTVSRCGFTGTRSGSGRCGPTCGAQRLFARRLCPSIYLLLAGGPLRLELLHRRQAVRGELLSLSLAKDVLEGFVCFLPDLHTETPDYALKL